MATNKNVRTITKEVAAAMTAKTLSKKFMFRLFSEDNYDFQIEELVIMANELMDRAFRLEKLEEGLEPVLHIVMKNIERKSK